MEHVAKIRRRFDGRKLGRYEKSDSVHKTGKDMDVQLRNVKRLAEVVENMGKMQLEEVNEEKGKNPTGLGIKGGFRGFHGFGNPFECGCRDVDFESKKDSDEMKQMRNLREDMAEMSLR